MMKSESLKRCPFCGGKAEGDECIPCGYVRIHCPNCGAMITSVFKSENQKDIEESETYVVNAWNKRENPEIIHCRNCSHWKDAKTPYSRRRQCSINGWYSKGSGFCMFADPKEKKP